jgi:eukaryotic-like serine/threonine-protein kinase
MTCDPSFLDAALGERFASFKLLGKGGEGAVFAAWDRVRKADLALKVMRDVGAPGLPERFEREYQILAATRDNHLVSVYDHGQSLIGGEDGKRNHFWYTMERCDSSLRTSFQRMPLPGRIAVVIQLLDGLALLHAKMIAHRDIKPDNLFLVTTRQGLQVKIGDFGIATVARTAPNAAFGLLSGSPPYLAPERWTDEEDADWRPSDQYAAGVTLYELLSGGTLPLDFTGGYRRGHLRSGIRPLQIPELGGRRLLTVDQVVARMLAKRADIRFASIADCKRELTAALANEGASG